MLATLWASLGLCLESICDPSDVDNHGYDEYKEDRTTAVHATMENVDVDYIVGARLGQGGFGLVKEGVHRKTSSKVALKFVDRKGLSKKDEKLIMMEAGILTGLKHGHVVEMRGFYKWDTAYCLALEHMAGGELCDDIIRRVNYSEADARNIILQVLDALAFLHRRGIVHRDVKPENLLLVKAGGDHVKLADFGLATVLSPPHYKVVEPVGTPGYAAPEVLRVMPYDGQVDVFSLGVISFILLSGYLPFGGSSVWDVVKATIIGEPSFDEVQWSAITKEARDFVKALINTCPRERPTADSALSHPWMMAKKTPLLTRSLSDRRSGHPKPLLEEFHALRKRKLKGVVGAVVAANRLHKFLSTGQHVSGPGNGNLSAVELVEAVPVPMS